MNKRPYPQEDYWDSEAQAFQKIYSAEKPWLGRVLDRIFRRDMFERFEFTLKHCEPIRGRTFLDVGCGGGQYSLALAARGAARVVGIDISEKMLAICQKAARQAKLENLCAFQQSSLLDYRPDSLFDVAIAIGLFDYVAEPLPALKKLRQVIRDKAIISFPRLWTWRAPVRKVRLHLKGCPVYFYSRQRIEALMGNAGFQEHSITRVGKLYCVIGFAAQAVRGAHE